MEQTKEIVTEFGVFKINIVRDDDAGSPREDDNFGTMVCFHTRYRLGDEHSHGDPDDFLEIFSGWDEDKDGEFTRSAALEKIKSFAVILPLYLYDHSGITMNTSGFNCRWDSGQVGWIYADKKTICDNWNVSDWNEKVSNGEGEMISAKDYAIILLESEVETYDDYLTGNVYGFEIIDPDGDNIDSCWRFFGDPEKSGCLEEAESAANCCINNLKQAELQEAQDKALLVYSERFQ